MKAGHKFLLGAALIVGSVAFLITEGVRETGVYFLTPTELAQRIPPSSRMWASRLAPRWCLARCGATRPAAGSTSRCPTG